MALSRLPDPAQDADQPGVWRRLHLGRTTSRVRLENGRKRVLQGIRVAREDWAVLLREHHEGYISWEQFEANQRVIADNANMKGAMARGAVRVGTALLAGLLRCGHCGRKLHVAYAGRQEAARYHCKGANVNHGVATCTHRRPARSCAGGERRNLVSTESSFYPAVSKFSKLPLHLTMEPAMSDRTDLRPSQFSIVLLRLRKIGVSVQRALFGVGLMRTGGAILRKLRRTEPDVQNWKANIDPGSHPFDTAFGVETGGFISWRDLQSGSASDPYISGYLGVVPSICRRMIDAVESPAHYVFTDYGCGKGRAAIIASEQPFRRVIGIEIVDQLAETARRNAAIIANNFPRRPAIEIVHDDASHYELPLEPLVMFFFQPFERPVMQAVLDRLERSGESGEGHYALTRLARKSSSQPAALRRSRIDCLPGARRVRLAAICLMVEKLAGA